MPAPQRDRFAARPIVRLLGELADAFEWPRSRPVRVVAGERASSCGRLVLCADESSLTTLDAPADAVAILATPPAASDGRAGRRAYDPFIGSDGANARDTQRVVLDAALLLAGGRGGIEERVGEQLGLLPLPGMARLAPLRTVDRDVVKFVGYGPADSTGRTREAVFNAGAGHIGAYDRCSWATRGIGSFRGGEGTTPTVGAPGEFTQVDEVRFEVIVPRHLLTAVTRAYIAAHPYEEPAFDVLDLTVPALVGFGRVGAIGGIGGSAIWTNLGNLDPELLAYGAPDKVPAGAPVAFYAGAVRDVFAQLVEEPELGLVIACAASDAEIDALTELGASLLIVDHARLISSVADALAAQLSRALTLPVTVAPSLRFQGFTEEAAVAPQTEPAIADVFAEPAAAPAAPAASVDATTGTWRLHFDGGSRGNPGPASYGWVLYDPAGNEAVVSGVRVGTATNNVAEWTGLLRGLEHAAGMGIRDLDVRGDSELIVKQFNGVYKVKNADLKPIAEAAKALKAKFGSLRVSHVYRADNARADQLANEAMDGLRNA